MKTKLLTICLLLFTSQVFADDHEYENSDPSAPWNDPFMKDDFMAPWNDPFMKDDFMAPWNSIFSDEDATNEYLRDNGVDDESYYWD